MQSSLQDGFNFVFLQRGFIIGNRVVLCSLNERWFYFQTKRGRLPNKWNILVSLIGKLLKLYGHTKKRRSFPSKYHKLISTRKTLYFILKLHFSIFHCLRKQRFKLSSRYYKRFHIYQREVAFVASLTPWFVRNVTDEWLLDDYRLEWNIGFSCASCISQRDKKYRWITVRARLCEVIYV